MFQSSLPAWCAAITIVTVGFAMITDLRSRRIPNYLTFPAFFAAIVLRIVFQGWAGLGLAFAGAVIAPVLLLAMHGGKGIGMGDLKLTMAVGAIMGPVLATAVVMASAIAGGFLAIAYMFKPGGYLHALFGTFLIGLPFIKKDRRNNKSKTHLNRPTVTTMPYGVAIGVGSLITLAVCWWTGQENWFLSFVGIAGTQ